MTDHLSFSTHWARLAALLLCAPLVLGGTATAQSLRPSSQINAVRTMTPAGPQTADYIVVLVNSEPITNNEVRQRVLRVEQQLTQQGAAMPPRSELARQVMEQLVGERAQLQQAIELGLRVDEATLLQTEQSIAEQNQLSLEEFRRRMAEQGMDINRLRSDLSNQILLQRVRDLEVESRVRVTEADIDAYIREKQANIDLSQLELNLAHVLVLVPEGATEEQVRELQARAQAVADRARSGFDFAALARDYSDAPERTNGGVFGMRAADRLPALFVEAVQPVPAGGIAGPFRSPAGFHVLKVLEKNQAGLPETVITQTRARHILLRTSPQLSQDAALARLSQLREQVTGGQASFPALAREHSQDGSARQGGDLGWANPGQFVPEFEEAMNALRPGEISQPLVSRFGAHLIRVDERRDYTLTPREQREVVRGLVREQKADDALQSWVQDVRSRAFVEYREAPQL
ncbi:MAG: peptidylprolyl isomerase [Hydrogenophaga sp.]|uniref:peptidylprolyl isomerase n=1 Tax=Hydrogenophaga sp. TaxID=1904254 RepID=UPI002753CFDE|nr:peptidylprolyl isomerase [Hydrogenophaga sp.]MDP2416578.1 peptidylprolyl isomerase [Hydrogenophaga sp.]MDZ4187820.1 peptidylprolyl isomerase [Hydrogenophaga sp.]